MRRTEITSGLMLTGSRGWTGAAIGCRVNENNALVTMPYAQRVRIKCSTFQHWQGRLFHNNDEPLQTGEVT